MMKIKILIIVLSLWTVGQVTAQSFLDANKKKIYKELTNWSETYSGLEHINTIDKREFYNILNKAGEVSAILVLSSVQGRFENFDIMTIIVSKKITLIRILKYRSEYGSEVSNKKWLSQFYNKSDDTFIFRKNIVSKSFASRIKHNCNMAYI